MKVNKKSSEIVEQYRTKGKEITIEDNLTSRSYEDKDDQKRFITEVVVNELLIQVRVLTGLLGTIGYFPGGIGEGTTLSTACVLFK